MNLLIDDKIKCLPVFQNQQDFLIGVFRIGTILKFTTYTKRLIVGFDENNLPIYNEHIQRFTEPGRVKKIVDFLIEDPNATFPTNIVLHIPSVIITEQNKIDDFVEIKLDRVVFEEVEKAKRNEDRGNVYITIIDGQHRIKGIQEALYTIDQYIITTTQTLKKSPQSKELINILDGYSKRKRDLLNIQVVVSFFVDKTLEYQAMIFSTINRTQKRVSEDLVSSLFGLTSSDSPQRSALQIVLALNASEKSPFFNRINLYGNDYETGFSPPLSQATMVKSIVTLICENIRESERDRYRKRKELRNRPAHSSRFLPFREYYANNQDNSISDIFYNYFRAVETTFTDSNGRSFWSFNPETMKPSNVLQTAVGYFALLNTLVDILKELPEEQRYGKESYILLLSKAKSIDLNDQKRYPLTTKSRSILYLDINLEIWPAATLNDPRVIRLQDLLNEKD